MKRRTFLGGLLGALVAGPAVAKAVEKIAEPDIHEENVRKFFQKPYDYEVTSVANEDVTVYVNGVLQEKSDYKVVGNKVEFNQPITMSSPGEATYISIFYRADEEHHDRVSVNLVKRNLHLYYYEGPAPVEIHSAPFSRTEDKHEKFFLSGRFPNLWMTGKV